MDSINAKVPAATAGGVGGYTVGKALAIVVMHYAIAEPPPHVALAIEFIFEGAAVAIGTFLSGWYVRSA